jgi:DNA-binding CsgD family transcriptional regulator
MAAGDATELIGRHVEQRALAALVAAARGGRGGAVVLRGAAGVGKTALLDTLTSTADGMTVLRVSGAETGFESAYSGLSQLCSPVLDRLDRLPRPQSTALRVALGQQAGSPPDALLVGLGLLTLLSEASAQNPIVCIVDDAQWIDSSSLLCFGIAARRIGADPMAMIFAARDETAAGELTGLPQLPVNGLSSVEARALLSATLPGRVDERVLLTIIAEAHGNPLALLELPRTLSLTELAGGYGLPEAASSGNALAVAFGNRVRDLPPSTRSLLLLAACEPAGRADWLWAAAEQLDLGPAAAEAGAHAGLLSPGDGIRFRHPLIRAAIYREAPLLERRRAHAALAGVITEPDHRAWHRARATASPDEDVASDLERSAQRARARGGLAASGAFLANAAALSPNPHRRARRALDAAQAKLEAGTVDAVEPLLTLATSASSDETVRARADLLNARMAFTSSRGRDAPPLLLAAARRLADVDTARSRESYLDALMAAVLVGRLGTDPQSSVAAIAASARIEAPPAPSPPRAIDRLLDGLVIRFCDGYAEGADHLRQAITAFLDEDTRGSADPRWHEFAHRVCLDLFDQVSYNHLVGRQLTALRATGALSVLPAALITEAGLCVTGGSFAQAERLLTEAATIVTATTGHPLPDTSIHCYLAAYRGQEALCRDMLQRKESQAKARGQGFELAVSLYAAAILHCGLGQFEEALTAATEGAGFDDTGIHGYLLVELVEAAVRCGRDDLATTALRELTDRTDRVANDTAAGVAARSDALVGAGAGTDTRYRDALDHLGRSPARTYLARTHLVYGEWLRGQKRRADARDQLRIAHQMFAEMGAEAFARRARRELRSTGETVHNPAPRAAASLTGQETQIVTLVKDGLTNNEIGERLFLSPRTVEWHLGRIFAKTGVTSRRDLRTMPVE